MQNKFFNGVCLVCCAATLALFILKCCGVITWPWLAVLVPGAFPVLFTLAVIVILYWPRK